jgi:hypothetical protein
MRGAVACNGYIAQCRMLGSARVHAFAPHFEGARFHLAAHQAHDGGFFQAKLRLNRFKGRAIFPSHLDDAGNIGGVKRKTRSNGLFLGCGNGVCHQQAL